MDSKRHHFRSFRVQVWILEVLKKRKKEKNRSSDTHPNMPMKAQERKEEGSLMESKGRLIQCGHIGKRNKHRGPVTPPPQFIFGSCDISFKQQTKHIYIAQSLLLLPCATPSHSHANPMKAMRSGGSGWGCHSQKAVPYGVGLEVTP